MRERFRQWVAALSEAILQGAHNPLKRPVFIEVGPLVTPKSTGDCTSIELHRNRMDETLGPLFRWALSSLA
ncbi:MAG: hypothetical protein ACJ797_07345 [Ktedonobacteraceae bacterium]